MTDKSTRTRPFVLGAAATLLMLALVGLTIVLTGAYDVAATKDHTALTRWALHTTMENSVKSRAGSLTEPVRFTPQQIVAGGGEYKAMCQQCHGGPGADRAEWARGLNPSPPNLIHAAEEWRSREVFWILKHGIKMSAMPSFGGTHDDPTLWTIAGFVKQLPTMSAAQYAAIRSEEGERSGHGGHEAAEGHHH